MRCAGMCLVVGASLLLVPSAPASELLGDRDVTDATLQVNGRGEASSSYTRSTGAPRRVLVWGAVNACRRARASHRCGSRMTTRAAGGSTGRQCGAPSPNRCQLYDGPSLPNLVAACKAPDGSYWALQHWQRYLRCAASLRSARVTASRSSTSRTGTGPYRSSRFPRTGPTTAVGRGSSGDSPTRASPCTASARPRQPGPSRTRRYVYIDTLNSRFGPGWQRAAGILTHVANGAFCYSFVPQEPPPGYPATTPASRAKVTGIA